MTCLCERGCVFGARRFCRSNTSVLCLQRCRPRSFKCTLSLFCQAALTESVGVCSRPSTQVEPTPMKGSMAKKVCFFACDRSAVAGCWRASVGGATRRDGEAKLSLSLALTGREAAKLADALLYAGEWRAVLLREARCACARLARCVRVCVRCCAPVRSVVASFLCWNF